VSILKRAALNWFGTVAPAQRDPGVFWDRGGPESYTGIPVSHEMAMTYSAVFAAVRLISHGMSSLPVGSYVSFGPKTFVRPKPPWMLKPNPETDWPSFVQQMMASILLGGDSFSAKVYARGVPQELWPIDPRLVVVDRDTKTYQKIYEINGQTLTDRDILHIPGIMLPGALRGLSPVEYMRQTIGLGLGAEKHGSKQLANAATPNVIITVPGKVDDDVAKKTADRFDRLHAGLDQVGKTAVLGGGATVNALSITNEQMQFLQTRQFQVSEVARWFGIPPHMLADVTSSTSWGTGIEQMQISFVVFALTPWVKFVEAAFKPLLVDYAQTVDTRGNADWYCKFNLNALMRGDMAARATFYRELANVGAISPNWILNKEDENPYVGGEAHYINGAYAPIGSDGMLMVPEPPAPPEPAPPEPAPVTNNNVTFPEGFMRATVDARTTVERGAVQHHDAPVNVDVHPPEVSIDAPVNINERAVVVENATTMPDVHIDAPVHIDERAVVVENTVQMPEQKRASRTTKFLKDKHGVITGKVETEDEES